MQKMQKCIKTRLGFAALKILRVLGIATTLLIKLHQQNAFPHVFTLQVRFLNPKLHVRLVLEKLAWHIRVLPEICYNLA